VNVEEVKKVSLYSRSEDGADSVSKKYRDSRVPRPQPFHKKV
jgi:hypothetical protein